MLERENWEEQRVKEIASFNVRKLSTEMKQDDVAGNTFYFLSSKDGYDASRILNEALLEEMRANTSGELAIGVLTKMFYFLLTFTMRWDTIF